VFEKKMFVQQSWSRRIKVIAGVFVIAELLPPSVDLLEEDVEIAHVSVALLSCQRL
jgi:hypothetical protein